MTWTAVVPFRNAGPRKTRLSAVMGPDVRAALADAMFAHVVAQLACCKRIDRILPLASRAPTGWQGEWRQDGGQGLNAELDAAWRDLGGPLLVVHADLPMLGGDDLDRLLDAAESEGRAIAPDRGGSGTNALARHDARALTYSFGPDSCSRHLSQGPAALVKSAGLALDVDEASDLLAARQAGFDFPAP